MRSAVPTVLELVLMLVVFGLSVAAPIWALWHFSRSREANCLVQCRSAP